MSSASLAAAVVAIALYGSGACAQVLDDFALEAAARSPCGKHVWAGRGKAPVGFIKGMAASYAKTWCDSRKVPDSVGTALAGTSFGPDRDALVLYGRASGSSDDRLRAIYALAIGEGMRESSGNTSEGYDRTVKRQTEAIAEAGLFQVSFDSLQTSPLLHPLWDRYAAKTSDCMLPIFEQGIRKINRPVVGKGKGAEFQTFTRTCPAFAVEYAAVMMRANRNHFGPVKRKEAELLPACITMFREIETVAQSHCP